MRTRFLLFLSLLPLLLLSSCDEKDGPTIIPPKEKPAYYDVTIRATDHQACKEITPQADGSYFVDWTDGFDAFFFMDIQARRGRQGSRRGIQPLQRIGIRSQRRHGSGKHPADHLPRKHRMAQLLLRLQELHSHIDRLGEGDLQLYGGRTQQSSGRTMDVDARRCRRQCAHPDLLYPQHPSGQPQPREQIILYRHRGSLRPTGTGASAN